jgi:hypothetical protein
MIRNDLPCFYIETFPGAEQALRRHDAGWIESNLQFTKIERGSQPYRLGAGLLEGLELKECCPLPVFRHP